MLFSKIFLGSMPPNPLPRAFRVSQSASNLICRKNTALEKNVDIMSLLLKFLATPLCLTFKNFCGIAYVMLIDLKNDYNGVIRGPYLSRGDTGHRTKLVRTASKTRSLNLTSYWNLVYCLFFSVICRSLTEYFRQWPIFFFSHNDRKKFETILV